MRYFLLVLVGACGAAPPPPPPTPLPPETQPQGTAPEVNPECIPAGTYKVIWDLSKGTITRGGAVDDDYCLPAVENLARQGLGEMTIGHAGGVTVAWPGTQRVVEKGPCAFEITSRSPANARITFSGGTGNGTASFSVGTAQRCDIEKAEFMLTKD